MTHMPERTNVCDYCKHYQKAKSERKGGPCCDAFPDGIPEYIFDAYDHRDPFPGDKGIRFEERDGLTGDERKSMQAEMNLLFSPAHNTAILELRELERSFKKTGALVIDIDNREGSDV
ncbi:MAG: hypothetical protein IKS74_04745 [Methanomicrobium sp.]|nr:hypothetical protein [Methanomicrobium sp.]